MASLSRQASVSGWSGPPLRSCLASSRSNARISPRTMAATAPRDCLTLPTCTIPVSSRPDQGRQPDAAERWREPTKRDRLDRALLVQYLPAPGIVVDDDGS